VAELARGRAALLLGEAAFAIAGASDVALADPRAGRAGGSTTGASATIASRAAASALAASATLTPRTTVTPRAPITTESPVASRAALATSAPVTAPLVFTAIGGIASRKERVGIR